METEHPYDFVAFQCLKELLQADVLNITIIGCCRKDNSAYIKTSSKFKSGINEQQPENIFEGS